MNFASDNTAGAPPEIVEAIRAAAAGRTMPYGNDAWSERVQACLRDVFETDCTVFPVATGTAANCLGLAAMTPPWGAVYCHELAHVNVDECGAPELFTGGAKLVPLPGAAGKIGPETLERTLRGAGRGVVHHVQPAALSLTQASECGTSYRPEEIAALAELARGYGMGVQMDGARFANALVYLGCSPAELTWKAGVDVLTFGATKNGCFAAEAVVVFKQELARDLGYRRKRGGHLFSKMRLLTAQLEAYLADDLWLRLARHANAMTARLSEGLDGLPGIERLYPVEANELFVTLPAPVAAALREAGFIFYDWAEGGAVRLICAFDTTEADVDAFIAAAAKAARAQGAGESRRSA